MLFPPVRHGGGFSGGRPLKSVGTVSSSGFTLFGRQKVFIGINGANSATAGLYGNPSGALGAVRMNVLFTALGSPWWEARPGNFINTQAGFDASLSGPNCSFSHSPNILFIIKTGPSLANARIWIGAEGSVSPNSDSMDDAFVGFRLSSVAGDTKWTPVACPNTASAQTVGTPIGADVAVNTVYALRANLDSAAGSCVYSVEDLTNGGTASTTISTANVPTTNSRNVRPNFWIWTQSANDRNISFRACYFEYGETFTPTI